MLILNLEKKKIFSKVALKKNIKNLKIKLKKEGCYNNKYIFYYTKKIKKKNIIISFKKNIIFGSIIEFLKLNKILINMKKKIKIKNKNISKICNCKFSFNF